MPFNVPTVEDLKRHLRIRHANEDDDLEKKLAAAITQTSEYLNRDVPWLDEATLEDSEPAYEDLPESVHAAILLFAEVQWRGHDEPCKAKEDAAYRLLWPSRIGQGV